MAYGLQRPKLSAFKTVNSSVHHSLQSIARSQTATIIRHNLFTSRLGSPTAIHRVDGGTSDEKCFVLCHLVESVQAQRHVKQNGEGIFAAVD